MSLTKGKKFAGISIAILALWYLFGTGGNHDGEFFGPFPLILPAIVILIIGSIIDKPKFQPLGAKSPGVRTIEMVGLVVFVVITALLIWRIFTM